MNALINGIDWGNALADALGVYIHMAVIAIAFCVGGFSQIEWLGPFHAKERNKFFRFAKAIAIPLVFFAIQMHDAGNTTCDDSDGGSGECYTPTLKEAKDARQTDAKWLLVCLVACIAGASSERLGRIVEGGK